MKKIGYKLIIIFLIMWQITIIYNKILIPIFLKQNDGTCFARGKTEIIFQNGMRFIWHEFVHDFFLVEILHIYVEFVFRCLIWISLIRIDLRWNRFFFELYAILAQAYCLRFCFCPPALSCLVLYCIVYGYVYCTDSMCPPSWITW